MFWVLYPWVNPPPPTGDHSVLEFRSISRDEVTPCAYTHTSMSGSYPAVPAPPVLRRAWNA